jgi:hypothetical protein
VKVNRLEELPFRLQRILGTSKLKEMAEASAALGRPTAARDVCVETLRRMNNGCD